MRLVLIALHEGAEMKTHTAPGIISVQVLEGHLGFQAEGQTTELKPGQLLTLQTGLPHRVVARQESVFLLTMANPAAERRRGRAAWTTPPKTNSAMWSPRQRRLRFSESFVGSSSCSPW